MGRTQNSSTFGKVTKEVKTQKSNEAFYPGRKKLANCGVDTSGLSAAELFELERQQARAGFAKKDSKPPKSSPVDIKSNSSSFSETTKPQSDLNDVDSFFSSMDPFVGSASPSSLKFPLSDTMSGHGNTSPLMSILSSSLPGLYIYIYICNEYM